MQYEENMFMFCTFMWRNKGLLLQKFTLDIAWRQGNLKARSEALAKSKLTEKDDGRILFSPYLCERAQHGPFVIEGKQTRRMMKLTEDTDRHVTFHAWRDALWFDGMQDTFYLILIQVIPLSERRECISFGLNCPFFFLVPQAVWLPEAVGPAVGSKIRIVLAAPFI